MATQETSNPDLWNNVWSKSSQENNERDFWMWIKRESSSIRGHKIQDYIFQHIGSLKNLKIIEVGSGPGIYSFIFATLGAKVTLLDYSEEALKLAQQRFSNSGLSANYILKDALDLEPSIYNQYDVAMSFGTVEHFRYPERLQMIKAHMKLVHSGGVIAISVPNRAFIFHELLKAYLQQQDKWMLGFEGAFTRKEFLTIAKDLNLVYPKVIGSNFWSDFRRYLHIYRSTNLFKKILGQPINNRELIYNEKLSFLDDYLGADLVLLGKVKK